MFLLLVWMELLCVADCSDLDLVKNILDLTWVEQLESNLVTLGREDKILFYAREKIAASGL